MGSYPDAESAESSYVGSELVIGDFAARLWFACHFGRELLHVSGPRVRVGWNGSRARALGRCRSGEENEENVGELGQVVQPPPPVFLLPLVRPGAKTFFLSKNRNLV